MPQKRIRVVDSHTGGEPTRVVVDGFPDLGNASVPERLEVFRRDHDKLRSAIVREPRGHGAIVGALLCEPHEASAAAGVIFFNNVGYLGMCGHGTIGLVKTLQHLGRIGPGKHLIETPVGIVEAVLHDDGTVTVANVPSYRYRKDVSVEVAGHGKITGDIAYGGNWFFLIADHPCVLIPEHIGQLTAFAASVRKAIAGSGISGADGSEIDHIELFGPSNVADSRNFVLCPGIEYDRSPCGTGTSAKLACLYEDGQLAAGEVWRQESIIGSIFEGAVNLVDDKLVPSIRGSAFITAESELILNDDDPFCFGIV